MAGMRITGDQAIAYGALQSGVAVATSYPGSPSSSTIEFLRGFSESHGLYVEWSTNEKVAFETAVGASIGGVPALMGCKGVGFNVALDTVMVANLTDAGAGLVILLGDDPGAWATQNDQDTRPIAWGSELPMLEPATPSRRDHHDPGGLSAVPRDADARHRAHHKDVRRAGRGSGTSRDPPSGPRSAPCLRTASHAVGIGARKRRPVAPAFARAA